MDSLLQLSSQLAFHFSSDEDIVDRVSLFLPGMTNVSFTGKDFERCRDRNI
jgi:hypothetical protein